MKQVFLFLSSCLALFFLFSCEKEDEATDVVILCNSGSIRQTAESGKKLLYEIESFSIKANLKNFQITSFDIESGEKTLLDTTINIANFNYSFIYKAPEFLPDSITVKIKMKATDQQNNTQEFNCTVTVIHGTVFLPELSGIVLYSGASGKPDALSLHNPSQPFLKLLADSAEIDIYDYTEWETETLACEWRTNTDIRFTRVNSLNYALVTAQSLKDVYASVNHQKYMNEIRVNDIILIGREEKVVAVLQIVDVSDKEGVQNDYYRLNMKILPG
jgi:hypothetical protein